MQAQDPNLPLLIWIADALGELRSDVVFVGGCASGLLLTEPNWKGIRATQHVDAVVEAATLVQYYKIQEKLPARGFVRDADCDVTCRWKHKASGILFDLMPTHEAVLGFANRWYPEVVKSSVPVTLKADLAIRLISAPCFIATKFEAFRDRGRSDYLMSHDLEDLLSVVDGRSKLVEEFEQAEVTMRRSVAANFASLLADELFTYNVLPGVLNEPERAPLVLGRMRALASLG